MLGPYLFFVLLILAYTHHTSCIFLYFYVAHRQVVYAEQMNKTGHCPMHRVSSDGFVIFKKLAEILSQLYKDNIFYLLVKNMRKKANVFQFMMIK